MPNFDGTGPVKLKNCRKNRAFCGGNLQNRGKGLGLCQSLIEEQDLTETAKNDELTLRKNQQRNLETKLDKVKERITELEKE